MTDDGTPRPAFESDVVLRDGSTLRLRPVRPDDASGLRDLYARLSPESLYLRFHGIPLSVSAEADRLASADPSREFVLVAEAAGRVSGVATYIRDPKVHDRAEAAFAVADVLHGKGVGTKMLEALADAARANGVHTFDAYVLHDNDRMMRVFLDSGFEVQQRLDGGVVHVVLSLAPTPAYEARAAERSEAAATASMKHFFEPKAAVVIGANRERGRIGSEILHNLVSGGYTGQLSVVHPSATTIDGVPAYPHVSDVPGAIDLAVVCVPPDQVLDVDRKSTRLNPVTATSRMPSSA